MEPLLPLDGGGFGMGGGRRRAAATGGYGAEPISVGTSSGTVSGMAMAPTSGRVPRVRTRDRIKQFLEFGRSRRAAARTVMY
ncbi:hypothetical protein OPQ81_006543 [Rhizoctonia solani]|nr:hypothetical protein OPQ81_006543 [Rhizoctonia solani]